VIVLPARRRSVENDKDRSSDAPVFCYLWDL